MVWIREEFQTVAGGKPAAFPYADWEEKTRWDFVKPEADPLQAILGEEPPSLWRPMIVALVADAGNEHSYVAAAHALLEIIRPMEGHPKAAVDEMTLAFLNELTAEEPPQDQERLSHIVIYRPEPDAKEEPDFYRTLHVGPAVPKASLKFGPKAGDGREYGVKAIKRDVVLTAVIDDQIGIANQRFRLSENTTRILHFWRQGIEDVFEGDSGGAVVLGREFTKANIDEALAESNTDQAFYKRLDEPRQANPQRVIVKWAEQAQTDAFSDDQASTLLNQLSADIFPITPDQILQSRAPGASSVDFYTDIQTVFRSSISLTQGVLSDYVRPISSINAHGTAVLDIAAGADLAYTPAEELEKRPIAAVQLPYLATVETSGARFDAYVLQAVQRILYWADNFESEGAMHRIPVVINFSYGITAGRKNGTGVLESEIRRLTERRNAQGIPTVAVLPAGNTYRSLLNGAVAVETGALAEVEWRVLPHDFTPSFLEIRVTPDQTGEETDWELAVTLPGGEVKTLRKADAMGRSWVKKTDPEPIESMAIFADVEKETCSDLITLALAPTKNFERPQYLARPGTYKVKVTNLGPKATVRFDVQRDDTPVGYPVAGRQSYLDGPSVDAVDAETKVRRWPSGDGVVQVNETLNVVAGAEDSMMFLAGGTFADDNRTGKDETDRQSAYYSSMGESPRKPDVSAVTEQGRSAIRGVLASGTFSNSTTWLSGTSAAAPQVTRAIVELLLKCPDINMTKADILAALPLVEWTADDPRKGAGVLNEELAIKGSDRKARRRLTEAPTAPPNA